MSKVGHTHFSGPFSLFATQDEAALLSRALAKQSIELLHCLNDGKNWHKNFL